MRHTHIILTVMVFSMLSITPVSAVFCDVEEGTRKRDFSFGVAPVQCDDVTDEISLMLYANLDAPDDFMYDVNRRFDNEGAGGPCFDDVLVTGTYSWGTDQLSSDPGDEYPVRLYGCEIKCDLDNDVSPTHTYNFKGPDEVVNAHPREAPDADHEYLWARSLQDQARFDCDYDDVPDGLTWQKYIEVKCTYVTEYAPETDMFHYDWVASDGSTRAMPAQPVCDLSPNSSTLDVTGPLLDNTLRGGITINDYNTFYPGKLRNHQQGIITHRAVIPIEVTGSDDGASTDSGNLTPVNLTFDVPDGVDSPDGSGEGAAREDELSLDKQEQVAIRKDNVKKEQVIFEKIVQLAELLFSAVLLLYYMLQIAMLVFVFTEWVPAVLRAPVTMLEETFLRKGGGR